MTNPTNQASGVAEPDDERAKFEAWYIKRHGVGYMPGGNTTWANAHKADDWEVWQARAALATKPAAPAEVVADASEAGYEIDPKSTVAELAAHVGAWETPEGFVSFGSWMALAAFRHHVLVGAAKQWEQMDEARAALRTPAQAPSTEAVAWRCGEFLFNSYEEAYECQTHDNSYAIEPLFVGAPVQPASPAAEGASLKLIGYYTDWAGERRYAKEPQEINEPGLVLKFDADYRPEDYWHPMYEPATPHPAVAVPGSLTAEQVAGLLSQFEVATVRCAQMHREYLGKAMSDPTYNAFATLRDDTIPALRKRLIAALATTSTAAQPESGVKP